MVFSIEKLILRKKFNRFWLELEIFVNYGVSKHNIKGMPKNFLNIQDFVSNFMVFYVETCALTYKIRGVCCIQW